MKGESLLEARAFCREVSPWNQSWLRLLCLYAQHLDCVCVLQHRLCIWMAFSKCLEKKNQSSERPHSFMNRWVKNVTQLFLKFKTHTFVFSTQCLLIQYLQMEDQGLFKKVITFIIITSLLYLFTFISSQLFIKLIPVCNRLDGSGTIVLFMILKGRYLNFLYSIGDRHVTAKEFPSISSFLGTLVINTCSL